MFSIRGVVFVFAMFMGAMFHAILVYPFVLVRLVSQSLFHRLVGLGVGLWLSLPPAMLQFMMGTRVVISGDLPRDRGESALIILNHRTRLDWMLLWSYITQLGSIQNHVIVLKDALRSYPAAGSAMELARFMFLSRSFEHDLPRMKALLKSYVRSSQPIQLLIFPEGTNLTEYTRGCSDKFAAREGLPSYEQVLHPRTRGFVVCANGLRHKIDAIWDVTVAYTEGHMIESESDVLKHGFPCKIHFHMERTPIAQVPFDDNEESSALDSGTSPQLEKWCRDRWREKEARLLRFYKNPSEPLGTPVRPPARHLRAHYALTLLYFTLLVAAAFVALYLSPAFRLVWFFMQLFAFLATRFGLFHNL